MIGQNYDRRRVGLVEDASVATLDVLVATKHDRRPTGLEYLPVSSYGMMVSTRPGWAKAANEVLDAAQHDAVFMDDDIELTPYTFNLLAHYWDRADVFGFTLLLPHDNGDVELGSAGYAFRGAAELLPQTDLGVLIPSYLAHVTASCMVVKKTVLDAGLRFPDWPGMHSEDVAFTLDCWLRGFKVAYLPGVAYHHIGDNGIGATKTHEDGWEKKLAVNKQYLNEWMAEHKIGQALADGVIPFGAVRL